MSPLPPPTLAGVLGTAKPPLVGDAAAEAGAVVAGTVVFAVSFAAVADEPPWTVRVVEALYATAAAPSVFWINLLSEASTSLALASFRLTSSSGSFLPLLVSSSSSPMPPNEDPYAFVGESGRLHPSVPRWHPWQVSRDDMICHSTPCLLARRESTQVSC